jgi:hypothetical protein
MVGIMSLQSDFRSDRVEVKLYTLRSVSFGKELPVGRRALLISKVGLQYITLQIHGLAQIDTLSFKKQRGV